MIATVYGDVHDIGKSLVQTILSNNGYTVHDLGKQVPVNAIVDAAVNAKADAIGLSALLVSTSKQMLACVQELDRRGLDIPVLMGGAAINRRFGRRALLVDGERPYAGGVFYCKDAFEGLALVERLTDAERRPRVIAEAVEEAREDQFLRAPSTGGAGPDAPRRSAVRTDVLVPLPPFYGAQLLDAIPLQEIFDLLDLRELFRLQWGGRGSGRRFDHVVQSEFLPALARLKESAAREGWLAPRAVYGYYAAHAEDDSVVLLDGPDARRERARFVFPRQERQERLCLADYVRPRESGAADVVALQVVTVGPEATERVRRLQAEAAYAEALYVHGLAVAAAEATAEWVHRRIRRELRLEPEQGRRYSWGYPACPELAPHGLVFDLLDVRARLGMDLTAAYQLVPEHSTAAFVVHHPEAKYFLVRSVLEK